MMEGKRYVPQPGYLYINHAIWNGTASVYKCLSTNSDGTALLANVYSGWTFLAHDIVRYDDGSIEWGYSTGGHFAEVLS